MFAAAAKRSALAAVSALLLAALSIAGAAAGESPKKSDPNAPSTPTNLHVVGATPSAVSVAWDPAEDAIGVAGYYVWGDRGKATVKDPTYIIDGRQCNQSIDISVQAFDDAGNRSERAWATVSTAACPDTQPPSVPAGFVQQATTQNDVVLAWPPSSDNVGVVGYGVYRDLIKIASPADPTVTLSGLACGSSTAYKVDAVDAAGNRSALGTAFVQTAACGDSQPPTAPANLAVMSRTTISMSLGWSASSDNVGVAGYDVSVGGSPVTTVTQPGVTLTSLTCGSEYSVSVNAFDKSGNRSPSSSTKASTAACPSAPPPGDTTAPSVPTGLAASNISQTGLSLAWNASNDNVAVTGYDVYKGGARVGTVSSTSSILGSLSCGTAYAVGVAARDAAGNISQQAQLTVSTAACPSAPPPGDTTAPSVPTGLAASNISQTGLSLAWNASNDNVAVTGYDVYKGGARVGTVSSTSSILGSLSCGTAYAVGVAARDAAGNISQQAQLTVSTAACPSAPPPGDTTPPSQPTNFAISSSTSTSVTLSWSASTDNVGVTEYRTYVNGALAVIVVQPGATVSALSCGTAYSFDVDAVDAAGNRSSRASLIATTKACPDTQAPTAPANVIASSRTATSIALTWGASTDNVAVTGYGLYRGGSSVGTASSTTGIFSGLTCNTNYTLAVDAFDAAGNRSSKTVVMVSTTACPDTTPPSAPTGLAASNISQSGLTLTWNASNDNVGVTGYDVFRGGTKMATVTSTSSSQTGLACGTSYTLGVTAKDAAGNTSQQAQLTVGTAACSALASGEPAPIAGQGYHLAFDDEFDTLDTNVWRRSIWYQNENDGSDVFAANGALSIVSRQSEGYPERHAQTRTKSWMQGYFEARMRFTRDVAGFPGFFMLSAGWMDTGNCTLYPTAELDVMEMFTVNYPRSIATTLHSNSATNSCGADTQNGNNWTNDVGSDLAPDWHIFSVRWTPTTITWYVDGKQLQQAPVYSSTNQLMRVIFQSVIHGGAKPIGPVVQTDVDWYRVWQK